MAIWSINAKEEKLLDMEITAGTTHAFNVRVISRFADKYHNNTKKRLYPISFGKGPKDIQHYDLDVSRDTQATMHIARAQKIMEYEYPAWQHVKR